MGTPGREEPNAREGGPCIQPQLHQRGRVTCLTGGPSPAVLTEAPKGQGTHGHRGCAAAPWLSPQRNLRKGWVRTGSQGRFLSTCQGIQQTGYLQLTTQCPGSFQKQTDS